VINLEAKELKRNLLSSRQVAETFGQALAEQKPISLVSLGTGEVIFLAYPEIPGFEELPPPPSGIDPYRKYISDPAIREEIFSEVRHANIIGVSAPLYNGEWPEAEYFFQHYRLPLQLICDGYIGRLLHKDGRLYEILSHRRVFLAGNHTLNLLPIFERHQIELAGHTEVHFFEDIPRVKDCLRGANFDFALIAAGIPTLILAPWVARTLGRSALDFGCAVHHLEES
jgi:hypothetical protein